MCRVARTAATLRQGRPQVCPDGRVAASQTCFGLYEYYSQRVPRRVPLIGAWAQQPGMPAHQQPSNNSARSSSAATAQMYYRG
mmetsp:Transcript_29766/g.76433  ORF Transcript_29766/g.76433 Transcript_29766/m.76433 type:complete len:83 (+) Transcript_29766:106-354(+)